MQISEYCCCATKVRKKYNKYLLKYSISCGPGSFHLRVGFGPRLSGASLNYASWSGTLDEDVAGEALCGCVEVDAYQEDLALVIRGN